VQVGHFLFHDARIGMMNRVAGFMEEPEERARAPDFWTVRTTTAYFFVSAETAAQVMKQLRRLWRGRWLRFVDLSGAQIVVATRDVTLVGEATAEQRAFDRALMKALSEESEEARPWE
jgi:hypothetical protein